MFDQFISLLDDNGRAWFSFLLVSRYLGFRLDVLCAIFLLALCVAAVSITPFTTTSRGGCLQGGVSFLFCGCVLKVFLRDSVDEGLIALGLTYSLALSGLLQWAVRQGAQAETYFTSGKEEEGRGSLG